MTWGIPGPPVPFKEIFDDEARTVCAPRRRRTNVEERPTMRTFGFLAMLAAVVGITSGVGDGARAQTVSDELDQAARLHRGVHVVEFVELEYPPAALAQMAEGAVVVDVRLDERGSVVSAARLSGPALLSSAAVANAKQWTFEPAPLRRVLLVYHFDIARGGFCHDPLRSLFLLRPPNLVSIAACRPHTLLRRSSGTVPR